MFTLILIITGAAFFILAAIYLILHKLNNKNTGTIFFFSWGVVVFVIAAITSFIIINANNHAIGAGEIVALSGKTTLYHDKDSNEYFVLSSEEWDLSKLAYRCSVSQEDAKKIIESYQLQEESNSILNKYR